MTLNSFFLNGSQGEQGLLQSLMDEQIKMYGIEVYYIPRKYVKKNTVIKEVIESKFDDAYPIEAYVDNYEGYGGQGTLLSKFGIQEMDDLTLIISRERFETYISPLMKGLSDIELYTRPKEGDIIYFPLGDRLFEIKYVEHEQPFYQLKKNYIYELRCELFRYEDEVIDTGVEAIDDEIEQIGYIQTLSLVGASVQATATASYVPTGGVTHITMTNMGNGYVYPPVIGIGSAPSGGTTASGIASMTNYWINADGLTGNKISAIRLTNAGAGYTSAPLITINDSSGYGSGAAATVGISTNQGVVGVLTLTEAGSGYTTAPILTFSAPPSGTTAIGIATISSAGIVTAIYIDHAGIGYTAEPTITMTAPDSVGSGGYIFNEIVTGSSSGTTARVKSWNANTYDLEVGIISGGFAPGENIVGQESGATYALRVQDKWTASPRTNDDGTVTTTPFADNQNIETNADDIIDFTEKNPFGMP